MKLTNCSNGHFYDSDKYKKCPHCGDKELTLAPVIQKMYETDPKTVGEDESYPIHLQKDESKDDDRDSDAKTVPIYGGSDYIGDKPVAGWVVCVEGSQKGTSFQIFAGMNFIGRNSKNNICIPDDRGISKNKHGIIIYDPKSGDFLAQPGMSSELIYLNEKVVLQPVKLQPYDSLSLGHTTLLFVPFCGERFSWDEEMEEEQK